MNPDKLAELKAVYAEQNALEEANRPIPKLGTPERDAYNTAITGIRTRELILRRAVAESITDVDFSIAARLWLLGQTERSSLAAVGDVVRGVVDVLDLPYSFTSDDILMLTAKRWVKRVEAGKEDKVRVIRAGEVRGRRPSGSMDSTRLFGHVDHFVVIEAQEEAKKEQSAQLAARRAHIAAHLEQLGVKAEVVRDGDENEVRMSEWEWAKIRRMLDAAHS